MMGSGTISIHAERLQFSDAPRNQNGRFEIVVKWLLSRCQIRFQNTISEVKESFKLLVAKNVKNTWR